MTPAHSAVVPSALISHSVAAVMIDNDIRSGICHTEGRRERLLTNDIALIIKDIVVELIFADSVDLWEYSERHQSHTGDIMGRFISSPSRTAVVVAPAESVAVTGCKPTYALFLSCWSEIESDRPLCPPGRFR